MREIKAKEAKDVKPTQRRKLARTDSIIQPELMMKNIAPTHSIVHKYSEGKKGGLQNISEDTGEQEHEEAEAEGEIWSNMQQISKESTKISIKTYKYYSISF